MSTKTQLMLFQVDSLVNHLVLQGNDRETMTTVQSGLRCIELYKRLPQNGLLLKMLMVSPQWRMAKHLKQYYLRWKLQGFNRKYTIFRLQVSKVGTGETEYGLFLKTPTAADSYSERLNKENPEFGDSGTLAQEIQNGFIEKRLPKDLLLTPTTLETPQNLDNFRERMKNYPNGTKMPNLITQLKSFLPTPTSQEIEHPDAEITETGRRKHKTNEKSHSLNLSDTVKLMPKIEKMMKTPTANEDAAGKPGSKMQLMLGNSEEIRDSGNGVLNPDWVDWFMGYPVGYTDIEVDEVDMSYDPNVFQQEAGVPRVTTRTDNRAKRIEGLGNAVVPQVVIRIFEAINQEEKGEKNG